MNRCTVASDPMACSSNSVGDLRERESNTANDIFRVLLDSAPDAMVIVDGDGSVELVNAQAEKLFGYSATELVGNPIEILVPARLREQHRQHRRDFVADPKVRAMGANLDLFALCKDGREVPVEVSLSPIRSERGAIVVTAIRDITERKQAEAQLRQSEERFRLILESIKDYAIIGLDAGGHIVSWNPGAQRIKGYSAEEIIGRHFSCFYSPEDIAAGRPDRMLQAAASQGSCEDEGWRIRSDGSRFFADVIISALYGAAQEVRGFVKITRDITERKRVERELSELGESERRHAAQLEAANKELEAFSYSVSHDLRAPLRSIDGFSVALLEDYGNLLDHNALSYLQRIRGATQRMAQLIDDLLSLARVTRTEMRHETVDLGAIAQGVIATLQKEDPQRVVDFVVRQDVIATGDPRLLHVVLDNLLRNAWKFTGNKARAQIELKTWQENGRPVFSIRDDGAGFDMQYASKLFGIFQRLHASHEFPGTGVGLAIVQRIIHRHGGAIWAEGEEGNGATFSFTLEEQRLEQPKNDPSGRRQPR